MNKQSSTIKYKVYGIKYDTGGENIDLPTILEVTVPANMEPEEADTYISDAISDITGFTHKGFNASPEIVFS